MRLAAILFFDHQNGPSLGAIFNWPKILKKFVTSPLVYTLIFCFSNENKKRVSNLLEEIESLSDVEKLYLYLKLPTGQPADFDPLKQ